MKTHNNIKLVLQDVITHTLVTSLNT